MPRARLWLKVSASLVLLAVLGAGAALIALKAFFPEPKARAYVLEKARKQLGREVRLERIDVGLTGLSLKGLAISERPDFAAGTFLSVESFGLRPSWKALLRRKLVVAAASADGLKVSVIKNADGTFNFSSLASAAPEAGAARSAAGGSAQADAGELNVRHLRVSRGEADYRDAAAGASWSAREIALKLDGFSLAEPFDLDVSLRAKGEAGGRPVDAAVSFSGTVTPARGDRDKVQLEFKRLSVEQDGVKLSAKGKIAGLAAPAADIEATVSAAGKTVLTVSGTGRAAAADAKGARAIDADLKFKTSGVDTAWIARWLPGAGIPALSVPAAEGSVSGLRWDGASADVKSARVSWTGGEVSGSGSARGLRTPKPLYGGAAKFGVDLPELTAAKYAWLKLPPRAVVPAMRLDGELTYGADGELALKSLAAKFKQGTASASGSVHKLGSAKPVADLALRFNADVPAFKAGELPLRPAALPADFSVPAMRLDGGAKVRGDDVALEKVSIKGKSGTLRLDGTIAKALAGAPAPELEVQSDLDLPSLTDKDLPLPGVPPGLELPASKWDADLSYTTKAIRLRRLGVKIGSNELSAEGAISDPGGRGAFDLLLKCKRFDLDELTRLTPRTRDLKLSGSGFFALSITGTKEKPVFGGKLQFKDLGATVAELPLSGFTGTASFDERRIDVPNLKGMVADGTLAMDMTIKEYARIPEIQVEASLDRFDLARYQEARRKLDADAAAAKAAKAAKTGTPAEEKPAAPLRTRGKLTVGELVHTSARAEKVVATWDLFGVTPDLKKLSGEAKLDIGGGKLKDIGKMTLPPVAKVLLFPVLIFQRIGLGVDLDNIRIGRFAGDYLFKDGLMTVRQSELDADKVAVAATGTIDLPTEALDMTTTANIGNLPQAEVAVGGTISNPKTRFKVGKLLQNAGVNLLNGLLRK